MSVVTFDIHIDDLDTVLALFDRVQVWRSPDELGDPTPYAEITSADNTPAVLDGTVEGPWSLSGTVLTVIANAADAVNISFVGANPWILADVLQAINAAIHGIASEVPTDTDRVRLTSSILGTGSSLLVSGSAVSVLGLPTTRADGKQARVPIVSPTTEYTFKDYDGQSTYWYKTRYFSTITGAASAFSNPRKGSPQTVLTSDRLSLAKVNLCDAAGRPVVNRRVILVPIRDYIVPTTLYGLLPGVDRIEMTTDENGKAELNLVRGATMKAFFEGSNYNREFVVPDTAEFDLLSVLATVPDPLSIVQAPPSPIRVS
jgi:hypothetical protein